MTNTIHNLHRPAYRLQTSHIPPDPNTLHEDVGIPLDWDFESDCELRFRTPSLLPECGGWNHPTKED